MSGARVDEQTVWETGTVVWEGRLSATGKDPSWLNVLIAGTPTRRICLVSGFLKFSLHCAVIFAVYNNTTYILALLCKLHCGYVSFALVSASVICLVEFVDNRRFSPQNYQKENCVDLSK